MVRSYYERLGVPDDATTEEIEAAYRERLKETHPDVSDDEDAGERTRRLVEARDVLVDDDERARYDRVGHTAYVGEDGAEQGGSDAAATARRAGYGESERTDPTRATNRQDRDPRERARERAAKERRGRETVTGQRPDDSRTETESETASRSGWDSGDGDRAWRESAGYTVRREVRTAGDYEQLLPRGRTLTLLVMTFALYPVLLFCALLPAFPLLVNATVALCVVLVVAYLQTYPVVAVIVFGGWTAIVTVAMMALAVNPLTVVGLSALAGTWLPFGFSLLTFWVLRW